MEIRSFLDRLRKAELQRLCNWINDHTDVEIPEVMNRRGDMVYLLSGLDESILAEALEETMNVVFGSVSEDQEEEEESEGDESLFPDEPEWDEEE